MNLLSWVFTRGRLAAILTASALLLSSCGTGNIFIPDDPGLSLDPPIDEQGPDYIGDDPTFTEDPAFGGDSSMHVDKPVIYLYGYNNADMTVKLEVDGTLSTTYPQIGSGNTWKFKALDDGRLDFSGNEYRYLFWDGDLNTQFTFNKGFCIRGSGTRSFLENKLKEFGFTPQERQDFITYWEPHMKDNPYNVISFQTSAYTSAAKLTVTPKPDKLIRIFMAWYPSQTSVNIEAQSLNIPSRSGKTVVEWGGSECSPSGALIQQPSSATGTVQGTGTQQDQADTGTQQIQQPVITDPYAIYGDKAQCAKDWDSSGISAIKGKWASISDQLKGEAYYHWQHYGKEGW